MIRWLLCVLVLTVISSFEGISQINFKEKSTEKIALNPDLKPENVSTKRRLLSIYVKDTKKILYGNPCMNKVMQRFGYEYVVMPKNAKVMHSGFQRSMHNFAVKTVLFFRNPFWKIISN